MDDTASAQTAREDLKILAALAEGVHPATGELLPADCPYHTPKVVRALFRAIRAIEARAPKPERPRAGLPANAGKPWSVDEDKLLLVAFDQGQAIKDIAQLHQRTYAGIEARLEKLGRLSPEQRTTSRRYPPASRQNGGGRQEQRG